MKRRKREKERARRKKGGEEKKAMAAPFFFHNGYFGDFGRKKKLLDAKGPFGGDVFKNMYGKLELKNWV